MFEENTAFQVGDHVVHWVYGLGEIIELDEKALSGEPVKYYVLQINDLTLWVPQTEAGEHCLRFPTPAKDFQKLFDILAAPGESLSPDRHTRKTQLSEYLKDGTLESICRVVRDLTYHKRSNRTNENDSSILERARNLLLDEWSVALSIPIHQAELKLSALLDASVI
jgi:RNA polymerase-interacting CarD/CdnL/TRCF family regulator